MSTAIENPVLVLRNQVERIKIEQIGENSYSLTTRETEYEVDSKLLRKLIARWDKDGLFPVGRKC